MPRARYARFPDRGGMRAHLVGGGIAGLASAAFLIREAGFRGSSITILEAGGTLGGSLDGSGNARDGYLTRGGRMLEHEFRCTFDLFGSVPTLDKRSTVTQQIHDWARIVPSCAKARLVRDGAMLHAPPFGLRERDILVILRMTAAPEAWLGRTRIDEHFGEAFFASNFWLMWATTFAFQTWHSAVEFRRYLLRFMHLVAGFSRLEGIMRTPFNQQDSLVRPLQAWLEARGVRFRRGVTVTDLGFREEAGGGLAVERIVTEGGEKIALGPADIAIVTLGSMTDASSLGGMDRAPEAAARPAGPAWRLWRTLAEGRPQFGRPEVFAGDVARSCWLSFTATLRDPTLVRIIRDRTGNAPGEGGLITFAESGWLLSFALQHQPHFPDQPPEVNVLWGYGLRGDRPGDVVRKPMWDCTGREILTELLAQLHIAGEEAARIMGSATCIPCLMPFITSQFMPRGPGDRPAVRPRGARNFAFVGQFCELPDDVVFTVEYSVRSAWAAVHALMETRRGPPPVHQGRYDPRVLWRAFRTLHDWVA